MLSGRRAAIACGIAATLVPRAARADEPLRQFRLAWVRGDGAASCPDDRELKSRVRERLGRDPFFDDAPLSIEGIVVRDGSAWHADLRIVDPAHSSLGERKLDTTAADCGPITEAVVLAVALTIDPSGRAAGTSAAAFPLEPVLPATAARTLEDTVPAASSTPVVPDTVTPARSSAPRSPPVGVSQTVEILARGGVAVGVLPRVAPFVSLASAYGRDPIWFTVALSFFPEQETDDGRFAFGLTSGSAGACYATMRTSQVAAELCAQLEAGLLHAIVLDTTDLVPLAEGDHAWFAAAAGPRLSWIARAPVHMDVGVLALAPIARKAFMIRDTNETVFESAPVAAIGYVSIGVGAP